MTVITEQYIKDLGFYYDEYEQEYELYCSKNIYINVAFSDDDFWVILQVHQATAHLSHIKTIQELGDLIDVLSE